MNLNISLVAVFLVSSILFACSSTVTNQRPLAKEFPEVTGKSLQGQDVTLPKAFAGEPVLLLVAYKHKTQFDVDRWLLGISQSKTPVKVKEIPTLPGIFPNMFEGFIDDGMRDGIPKEDWASVITLYDDAEVVVDFLGNEKPKNARAVLLDKDGKVVWVHDTGYSPRVLLELDKVVRSL